MPRHDVAGVRLRELRVAAVVADCPRVKFDGRAPTQHASRP
ncbi:MAG TPA: hypothetical protein VK868_01200 [Pyrinomonadaceae bacterium]|nr:hypothetical protein [Pyrinomonadaceae bacterium]